MMMIVLCNVLHLFPMVLCFVVANSTQYNPNHLDYENVHFDHNSVLVCMELFLDQDSALES